MAKNSAVSTCVKTVTGMSDKDVAWITERVAGYITANPEFKLKEEQAYINVLRQVIPELSQQRDALANKIRDTEIAAAKEAIPQYENAADAWADMSDTDYDMLPVAQRDAWETAFVEGRVSMKLASDLEAAATPTYNSVDEAWEDMRPDDATDYNIALHRLPRSLQLEWMNAVSENRATQALAEDIYNRANLQISAIDEYFAAMQDVKDSQSSAEYSESVGAIVEYAFFDNNPNNIRNDITSSAQSYINAELDQTHRDAINAAFIRLLNDREQIMASVKGKERPWYTYAKSQGLLGNVTVRVTAIPEADKALFDSNKPEPAVRKAASKFVDPLPAHERLAILLKDEVNPSKKTIARVTDLYQQVLAQNMEGSEVTAGSGITLKDYFNDDGTPRLNTSINGTVFTSVVLTPEQKAQAERDVIEAAKAAAEERRRLAAEELEQRNRETRAGKPVSEELQNVADAADNPTGSFFRDDGTPITSPMAIGRVVLAAKNFVSKLMIRPSVFVYKNVADLKARNLDLYARAKAARSEDDFDTTNAAGYSFDKTVIVFSDFIRTERHLKFVLAHEVLGHFGFRGVIPEGKLNAVLDDIYDADSDVRATVEAMMGTRGMSKHEAIEEYVADYAAYMDNSLIMRMWNVLANFLNKLGIKFSDDAARYLINQSRKYVRRGTPGIVTSNRILSDLEALSSEGRYKILDSGDLLQDGMRVAASNRKLGVADNLYDVASRIDSIKRFGRGVPQNVPGKIAATLEHIQTLGNLARKSYGLKQVYKFLEEQQHHVHKLLTKYHDMMQDVTAVNISDKDKIEGGELLAHAALLRGNAVTDAMLKKYPSLVKTVNGVLEIDEGVFAQLEAAGTVTRKEFADGFNIVYHNGMSGTKAKSHTIRFQRTVGEGSKPWIVYSKTRKTINRAALDLMMANYNAAASEVKRTIEHLNDRRKGKDKFSESDLAAIEEVARMYRDMKYVNSDIDSDKTRLDKQAGNDAEAMLMSFGRAIGEVDANTIYNIWTKNPAADQTIAAEAVRDKRGVLLGEGDTKLTHGSFADPKYDKLRAALPSLRNKLSSMEESFAIQKAVRDVFLADLRSRDAELYAKRTILGAYTPLSRRGDFGVRLTAYDKNGHIVNPSEFVRSMMPYFQFNAESEAIEAMNELNKEFGGDRKWTITDEHDSEITVQFKATYGKTRRTADIAESIDYNSFVYALTNLNIQITPKERERIVNMLTDVSARARHNLRRSGNPGWDKDIIRSASEHLEMAAHVAAKKLYGHRINDVLFKDSNWKGDITRLKDLAKRVKEAKTDGERARARRAYDEYAYMYQYMAEAGDTVNIIDETGKTVDTVRTLGRGEDYREHAKSVIRWYSDPANGLDTTADLLGEGLGSRLKMWTVLAQLGGSVASAAINLTSLATHAIPYLASYNPETAFGGGYGLANSSREIFRATSQLKDPQLAEAKVLEDIVAKGTYSNYGLTKDEAIELLTQTQEGILQAAQLNSLVSSSRGRVFNNKVAAAIKLWMGMFSYTEQLNRRATMLAAYRLEKARALAEGLTEEQAQRSASAAARIAVNASQGEYAMFNRSKMARGDIMQFVFMYKQFSIITIELLKAMPIKGRALTLGLMFLASGMKGLPFSEDIMDILDGIAQFFGLTRRGTEKIALEAIESIAPGWGKNFMRGFIDTSTGLTVSTRMSSGNLIPLTGLARAGSDPVREVSEFVGPVGGMISGMYAMSRDSFKYAMEAAGLKGDTTTISDITRNAPIAALRAVTDGFSYMADGKITNALGRTVSTEDVPIHQILTRMAGFYPSVATQSNDVVRMSKYDADYAKAVKSSFVVAYNKARARGDNAHMRGLLKDVEAWNRNARGTSLVITKFLPSANRAYREMNTPTVQRYIKTAPVNVRPEAEWLTGALGVEED